MSIKEKRPNDLFFLPCFRFHLEEKSPPLNSQVRKVIQDLPLANQEFKIVGSGDWGASRSSQRSVALATEEGVVVKLPLGKGKVDPFTEAQNRTRMAEKLKRVSPPTQTILARVQGEVKPVTLQKKVRGKPACYAPLTDLLKLQTLTDMRQILREKRKLFIKTNAYDLCGQEFKTIVSFLAFAFSPFFSDNIIVKPGGGASLVDNTPNESGLLKKGKGLGKFVASIELAASELFVSSLIILRKIWNGLDRLRKIPFPEKTARHTIKV